MFAAGRDSSSQGTGARGAGADAQAEDDWLSIGKSFSSADNGGEKGTAESALQVYKHRHGTHGHKEKEKNKEKKRRSDESTAVASRESRRLSKHKKKSKDKKRRRSRSPPGSNSDDNTHRCSRRSRRRRHHSRSNSRSRSRSQSRSRREENRIVEQSEKYIVVHGPVAGGEEDKIFEIDSVGDCDNRFFGSTYVHDQPLYELATRRNLLTGAWISRRYPKYTSGNTRGEQDEKQYPERYFSVQARKMERDARQKRLYLAYSEKRLARAEAQDEKAVNNHDGGSAGMILSRPPEMGFIPLDPVIAASELVGGNEDEQRNHTPSDNGGVTGVLLTDGQSVEQHLVERSKILNAAVAVNPRDIDSWLDLIAFQEQTLRLQSKTKKINPAIKASVEEKQAAILTKALASNPQSRELYSVKLNMELHSQASGEGADINSFQRQLETLLSDDISNSELWIKLLQSRQQRFGRFSMQSVRDLYARILTVLRAEYEKATKRPASKTASSAPKSEVSSPARSVQELSVLLLDFHFLMCTFEKKAGYGERSIAQLQALIDFSLNESAVVARIDSTGTHLEMLRKFTSRWNQNDAVGFGDEKVNGTGSCAEEEPPQLSVAEFEGYIHRTCVTTVDQVNPPEVLRTKEHKQSLLSASATYQRQSLLRNGAKTESSRGGEYDLDESPANSAASSDSKTESMRRGNLVYSNLHGYRISVDEADDTKEYERILNELRGTASARARQTLLLEKEKVKHAVLATTKSQVEDQRANYDAIAEEDHFVKWLMCEEVQIQLQWAPLRSSNPRHLDLIEQQPDRATLTEEIQPFLFSVPAMHQWRLIAELLQLCGVEWRGEHSWKTSLPVCESMYADCDEDYELLVAPILSALNVQPDCSRRQKLILDPSGRKLLLESALLGDVAVKQGVLRDPSKVAFIRRVFAQALNVVGTDFESILKSLWIGFEAEVTRAARDQEENLAYARLLSQKLAQKTTSGDTDYEVLHAYAKLELHLGNDRQVRRICETTLRSLVAPFSGNASSSRTFHRFVFLRARLEMWPSTVGQHSSRDQGRIRVMRCLYTLWSAWQPDSTEKETLDAITKKHRKQIRDYLHECLMSDPSTGLNLVARYRAELHYAIQHCAESTSQGLDKVDKRLHCQSDCWAGYCLHNLALAVYGYQGFGAACDEYRQALANIEHQSCSHLAWAWTCFLEFMQQHQAAGFFPAVAPRAWRSSIGEAVEICPSNELFLRLFVDSETGNTISQVLRNYFRRVEQRWQRHYDSPELVEWLFALLCEISRVERASAIKELSANTTSRTDQLRHPVCCLFHHWGMDTTAISRIRQMFESMVTQIRTKGNALCWRLYMRFEVALGKVDAAKKVLYRGIATCAWSKTLYLDGLRVLRAYLSEDECKELLEFMEAKELSLRIDFE